MISIDKIIVIGDRVLIKPEDKSQKTNTGLYLPPGVKEKEVVQSGYILKVGPGYPVSPGGEDDEPWKEGKDTKYIPLQAAVGDFAIFLRKDAVEIEIDGEKMLIVPQSAILLVHREDFTDF